MARTRRRPSPSPSTAARSSARGRDHLAGRASATAPRSRICATRPSPATAPTAIAAPAWSRSRASACSPRAASARRRAGMKVKTQIRSRQDRAEDGVRAADLRPARPQDRRARSGLEILGLGRPDGDRRPAASRSATRPAPDRSHPAMAVNLDACIQCNLCVRACREVQVNDVIGMAGRGHSEKIVFDFDDPMGDSTCVACGECVQACPTGALMPATLVNDKNVRTGLRRPRRSTASAPIAASAASSPTTSRTTSCSTSPAGTARRTRTGCA